MVQEANIEIGNDSYLIIVYGKDKDKVKAKTYDTQIKKSTTNLLNTVLKSNIATVGLAGLTSSIGQNIAGKVLPRAVLGRITSSVYDIMADGKVNKAEVAEDFIGSCTNAIDNVATDMGLPTPSSIYSAIMPYGSGVISKDFSKFLSKKMDAETKQEELQENQGELNVLKLKIVTTDNESWPIDIPTRKTEAGFEIATAISTSNKTKSFSVLLTTNTRSGTDMYQLKNQLEELKNLKEPFDIYINDKDVYHQYKWRNCVFSSLDFSLQGKNALQCDMEIVEIPEWNVEFVKLENYTSTSGTAGNSGASGASSGSKVGSNVKSGIQKASSSVANQAKTSGKAGTQKIYPADRQADDFLKRKYQIAKSSKKITDVPAYLADECKKMGYPYDRSDCARFIQQGWLDGNQAYTASERAKIKEINKRK